MELFCFCLCDFVTENKVHKRYDMKKRFGGNMTVQKIKRVAIVDEDYCVGCGSCIKVCPKDAISVPRGVAAQVDTEKCVGCGLCAKMCPASVIEIVKSIVENKEILLNEK